MKLDQLNMLKIENKANTCEGIDDFTAKRNIENEKLLNIPIENETLIYGNQVNVHCRDALSDVLLHKATLVENRTELHADGSVTETKLPELIFCFEDNCRLRVKDICVDDGSHTNEKNLLENNDAINEASSPFKASSPKFSLEQLLSLGDPDGDFKAVNSASFNFSTSHKQSMEGKNVDKPIEDKLLSTKASSKSDSTGGNRSIGLNDNPATNTQADSLPEGFSTITISTSDTVLLKQSNESNEVHTEEVDSGRTVPQFKSDSAANGREESRQNTGNHQQHVQTHSVTEDTAPCITISSRNSYYKYSDLHLSGPSYLAGPRVTSGHFAYSGSVSLRSDSSTTSTRSFAFPILQSEWNSSPVKMAKPDRRYIGKNRRLKMFFCCKF